MSDINDLLSQLYTRPSDLGTMEKTAEQRLLEELQADGMAESPYASMSTEELIKLAQQTEAAETIMADGEPTTSEILGGQVMAHAMVHEFGLMKAAMQNGLCRVCKSNPLDVESSSICSACASSD